MTKNKTELKRTICGFCSTGWCHLIETIENGKVVNVEPDWEAPNNPGPYCVKWKYGVEYIYHKDRPKYPMKRVGKRGEGKWQIIPWSQALDEISAKMKEIIGKYGAESIVGFTGTGRITGIHVPIMKFHYMIGSPNGGSGQVQH